VGDDYEGDRLYRRRDARRMPWQIAGILALLGAAATASQALWIATGVLTLIGAALLLFSLTR